VGRQQSLASRLPAATRREYFLGGYCGGSWRYPANGALRGFDRAVHPGVPEVGEHSMMVNNKKVSLRYCEETKKYRWTDDAGAVYSPDFDDYFEALAFPDSNELEIQS
jgi:hypothetical protein